MEVSPISMNISAKVKKEHGKDTYKKGLPQYLCFNDTISLLFSWQICIILSAKGIFLTTWLVLAAPILYYKVILWKNHRQSFFNQYGLYMACNVARV